MLIFNLSLHDPPWKILIYEFLLNLSIEYEAIVRSLGERLELIISMNLNNFSTLIQLGVFSCTCISHMFTFYAQLKVQKLDSQIKASRSTEVNSKSSHLQSTRQPTNKHWKKWGRGGIVTCKMKWGRGHNWRYHCL